MWIVPESKSITRTALEAEQLKLVSEGCDSKTVSISIFLSSRCAFATCFLLITLDKTILNLEMELAAARAAQESVLSGSPLSEDLKNTNSSGKRRYFMVVGINTAFSSRRRRDSVRPTWMPQGERRKKLEEEKGVIIRFVIGHSVTVGRILDRAIEAEDKKHRDLLRLIFTSKLMMMFMHVVHKYANEDVSLGAWFIGLDIVSGRPMWATSVLLHLIGAAEGFVGLLRGLRRSIGGAMKVRTLYTAAF
ncbi:hypothetical protein ACSBR2_012089 [Camellia fascicularis]